jgi:hypothetical protein
MDRTTLGGLMAIAVGHALLASAASQAAVVAETHRLEGAPYVVDVARQAPSSACAIVLPATVDPMFSEAFGYGDREGELAPLIAALNERIGAMRECVRGVQDTTRSKSPPRVYVGSAESDYAPPDVGDQRVAGDRFAPMVLHLARPGADWRREVGEIVDRAGADYAVLIHLGISQYAKGYASTTRKEVVLGTGYRQPIRFLTAEDKPVEVLHLTGVLVDREGRVIRAAAEGIVMRDTPFAAQVVDVERLFDEEELQRVLTTERRRDLPGAPLKIDVALDNLIAQLTRSGD